MQTPELPEAQNHSRDSQPLCTDRGRWSGWELMGADGSLLPLGQSLSPCTCYTTQAAISEQLVCFIMWFGN